MAKVKLYQYIAQALDANLHASANSSPGAQEWADKHLRRAEQAVKDWMPSGAGIDQGSKLDLDRSSAEKLVFDVSFHHMDEHGGYDGWTEHRIVVRGSLAFGIDVRISGPNRNDIKDYLGDVYHDALTREVEDR